MSGEAAAPDPTAHKRYRSMPDDLFDKISHSTGVLDSPTARAVTDGSVRLRAARAGAKRLRRRSSGHARPVPEVFGVAASKRHQDKHDLAASPTPGLTDLPKNGGHSNDLRTLRSRAASAMFWEEGTSEMPEEVSLEEAEVGDALSRGRALSMEMLEVELQQKDAELKMAAEIGLKLFEKSEASAAQCRELELQVRDQKRALEELEMENELMQRKFLAQRRRHEKISCENLKLTNEVAQVDILRDQLDEANRTVGRLELSISRANSRRGSLRSHRTQQSSMGEDWFAQSDGSHSRRVTADSSQTIEESSRAAIQNRTVTVSAFLSHNSGGDSAEDKTPTDNDGSRVSNEAGDDNSSSDNPSKILLNVEDVLQMEAMCEELEKEAQDAKEREEAARQKLNESTESASKEMEAANHRYRQLQNDNEQLAIEIQMSKQTIMEVRKVNDTLRKHSEEDKEMIHVLRSRIATLSDEIEELERKAHCSPRVSSADMALRMLDMELRSPGANESIGDGAQRVGENKSEQQTSIDNGVDAVAATAATTATTVQGNDLHDRLVAQLQSQTEILMNAQTDLNSAENQLQAYKRQVADWLKNKRPEITVNGNVDEERSYVLYELNMLQNGTICHTTSMRYSHIATFRSQLKRKLFVADQEAQSLRLPALPPKVWGYARSRSAAVVKQREAGLRTFFNVMIALAELSEIIGREFFDWIGWSPDAGRECAEEVEAPDEKKMPQSS
eukprot:g998.t1